MKRANELQDGDEIGVGVINGGFARVIGAMNVDNEGKQELWVTMAVPPTAMFEVGP